MHSSARALTCSLLSLTLLAGAVPAHAQDEGARPLPAPPPPPAAAVAADGSYVAPLSQTTQQTYVPQSVAMSGPRVITDYEEGDAVPPGYHATTRVRRGLVVGGSVLLGTLWLMSAMGAAISADSNQGQTNPAAALFIPAVGPFIQMGTTTSTTGNFFNVIDGVGQCAGLAMLIYGIASPKTVLVRNDLARPVIVPMRLGQNGYGMGLTTRF